MKRKKLLSTAVAGMLVAAQMVMPVMAAPDGTIESELTTKTGVLRVTVPTSIAIAVDQFEITHEGTQIAAGEFNMTNKSEIAVKVVVESTATLGSGISLVAKADDVADSEDDVAWLAIAAKTNDGIGNSGKVYDDPKTGDATTTVEEEFWELTDANSNVTSFAADTKKAEQTFYLAKGTGAASYKLAVPAATTQVDKTFAKFYELTAQADPGSDAGLQTLVNASDIYVVVTANIGNDGETVTKIAKGTQVAANTHDSDNTYYKAADNASVPGDNTDTKKYLYGEMATDGGKAGFTYIGKLSENDKTWTDADIDKITVNYTISGVTATRYNEVKDSCTYGLYTGSGSSTVTEVNGVKVTNASGATTYSTGADIASRLKAGAVQFVLDSTTATTVKSGSIAVTKIDIDGTEYTTTQFTATANSSANADSDGKTYSVTGFTANTVSTIKVYYGTDLVVKYTF